MTNRKSVLTIGIATVWLAAGLGGLVISAQDKYAEKVPGGLAFSEFKGNHQSQRALPGHVTPVPPDSSS